jgi:hypothetical protein
LPRTRFPPPDLQLDGQFVALGMRDVDLGFPGRAVRPRVREAIRELSVGTPLRLRATAQARELLNDRVEVVGRLAKSRTLPQGEIEWVRVSAIVHRSREQEGEPKYQAMCRVDEWEVVLCTVCVRPVAKADGSRAAAELQRRIGRRNPDPAARGRAGFQVETMAPAAHV